MDFNQSMGPGLNGIYLSATANYNIGSFLSMNVNIGDIKEYTLMSKDEQFSYSFPKNPENNEYKVLATGYMFLLIFAKKLFFFLGDLEAIQYLQYIVHILIVMAIISIMEKRYEKILFFIFYGINPVILYFVNYTFYYFWQVVPSAIFIYYYISKKKINNKIYLITLIFVLIFITRSTILFFLIFFYIWYGYKENWKKSLVNIVIFFSFVYIMNSDIKNPYHAMYVGIGAYENVYNIKLDDDSAFEFFNQKTNKTFNTFAAMDKELYKDYSMVIKEEYFNIFNESYLLLIRNAIYNFFQSYSLGHKVGNLFINYISIIIGVVVLSLLLYTKNFILLFSIGLCSLSFTLYFPPIAAYMYGSYILIVISLIKFIKLFRFKVYS